MKNIFNKKLLRNEVLHIVLLAVLAGVGAYFLYQNQHQQVLDLTNKNGTLTSANKTQSGQISTLQSSAADLTKQNTVLQNQVNEYQKISTAKVPQAVYSLKVNSVKTFWTPALFGDETNTELVVDVSITNTGNAAGYVSYSDFTVKDSNNVAQQTFRQVFGANQGLFLPAPQPSELSGQPLDAGDTARGSVVFFILTSQTSFTLKYNGQSIPITVDGKISR